MPCSWLGQERTGQFGRWQAATMQAATSCHLVCRLARHAFSGPRPSPLCNSINIRPNTCGASHQARHFREVRQRLLCWGQCHMPTEMPYSLGQVISELQVCREGLETEQMRNPLHDLLLLVSSMAGWSQNRLSPVPLPCRYDAIISAASEWKHRLRPAP